MGISTRLNTTNHPATATPDNLNISTEEPFDQQNYFGS